MVPRVPARELSTIASNLSKSLLAWYNNQEKSEIQDGAIFLNLSLFADVTGTQNLKPVLHLEKLHLPIKNIIWS